MTLDDHDPLGHVIEDEDSPRKLCPRYTNHQFANGINEKLFKHDREAMDMLISAFGSFKFLSSTPASVLLEERAWDEFLTEIDQLFDTHFGEINRQLEAAEKLP